MTMQQVGKPCADCVDQICTMNCSESQLASGTEWIAASIWAGVFPKKATAGHIRDWRVSIDRKEPLA